MYLLLLKIKPEQTDDVVRALKNLTEKPTPGVRLFDSYNVFGAWDTCIWFDADSHDNAMNFVQNKIRQISGVIETHTLPTTNIRKYRTMS